MHIGANNVAKFSLSVAELNSADDVTRDVTGATTTIGVCRWFNGVLSFRDRLRTTLLNLFFILMQRRPMIAALHVIRTVSTSSSDYGAFEATMVEVKRILGRHSIAARTCNNSYDLNCNKLRQLLGNSALLVRSFACSYASVTSVPPPGRLLLIVWGGCQQHKLPRTCGRRGASTITSASRVGGGRGTLLTGITAAGGRLSVAAAEATATPRDQWQPQEKSPHTSNWRPALLLEKFARPTAWPATCWRKRKTAGYKVYLQRGDVVRSDFGDSASIKSVSFRVASAVQRWLGADARAKSRCRRRFDTSRESRISHRTAYRTLATSVSIDVMPCVVGFRLPVYWNKPWKFADRLNRGLI